MDEGPRASAAPSSASGHFWRVKPRVSAAQLDALGDLPPLIAQLCWNRGLTTLAGVDAYFAIPAIDAGDPWRLPDMARAVDRIECAIRERELICIHGDYDVDGIAGATLLAEFLTALDARVTSFLPSRYVHGYGLKQGPIERLHAEGVQLLITVDCGVSNVREATVARGLGMELIITDHHVAPDTLPAALAVINPTRRDVGHEADRCLSGTGIAYRLAQALATRFPSAAERLPSLVELVALATVADVAPLSGQNRALVQLGLARLRDHPRPGLRALLAEARTTPGNVDEDVIGFRLGPRLNAAGRQGCPCPAFDLLATSSESEAQRLAKYLEDANRTRQRVCTETVKQAKDIVITEGGPGRFGIVAAEGWSIGLVGLVASKLSEAYYRPWLVMASDGTRWRGSARSIPGFNVTAALDSCAELLEGYGGHEQAAGCTVDGKHLDALRQRLFAYAEQNLHDETLIPWREIDARVNIVTLKRPEIADWLDRMAPFGCGNERPVFAVEGAQANFPRRVGADSSHLKFQAMQRTVMLPAIAFGFGGWAPALAQAHPIDLAVTLKRNEYQGRRDVELEVKDVRTSPNVT